MTNPTPVISEAYVKFRTQYQHVPKKLYLGRMEDRELRKWVEQYPQVGWQSDIAGTKRRTWEDMEIFVVDAENYLDFGL